MATLKEAIFYKLNAAGITAYPVKASQSAPLPYAIFEETSGVDGETMAAASDITETGIQIECWGETTNAADVLAASVISTLRMQSWTHSGTEVVKCFLRGETDIDGTWDKSDEYERYGKRLNFDVWWRR